MKWGETKEQKAARLNASEWRPWFAWHPVDLTDSRRAWLETVLRKRHAGIYWWVYEAPAGRAALDAARETGGGRS